MTKIIFFGSSSYSVLVLSQLLKIKDFKVISIVTKSDKPIGRTQLITPNPVAKFTHDNNLPLLQPEDFNKNLKLKIKNLQADLGLCVAYGPPFFDQEMIDLFKFKIVNVHPSPLPKYRGATPGPWQIIEGETKTAVTFFQIDESPDHGPIIHQIPFDIRPNETAQSFYEKAFSLAAANLENILKSYIENPNSVIPQDHCQSSYFPKFNKDSAQINWTWDPKKIDRFIRALNPWPIAWTYIKDLKDNQLKMKIFSFHTEPVKVQIEGKKITNWSEISKYYTIIK